jgi:hypothetical protein
VQSEVTTQEAEMRVTIPSFIKKGKIKEIINDNLPDDKRIAPNQRIKLDLRNNRQVISVELADKPDHYRIMGVGAGLDVAIQAVIFHTLHPDVLDRMLEASRKRREMMMHRQPNSAAVVATVK